MHGYPSVYRCWLHSVTLRNQHRTVVKRPPGNQEDLVRIPPLSETINADGKSPAQKVPQWSSRISIHMYNKDNRNIKYKGITCIVEHHAVQTYISARSTHMSKHCTYHNISADLLTFQLHVGSRAFTFHITLS